MGVVILRVKYNTFAIKKKSGCMRGEKPLSGMHEMGSTLDTLYIWEEPSTKDRWARR